jgi:hypothetical protein
VNVECNMTTKAVYYGRFLEKYPLTSYPSKLLKSKGIGGVIRPRNFYVPLRLETPKLNTALNVLDETVQKGSEFNKPAAPKEDVKLPFSESAATPNFTPIKVNEVELNVLRKQSRKRSPKETNSAGDETKVHKRVRKTLHRIKIID